MGLDIRWPIGLMFSLVGALLVIYGLATISDTRDLPALAGHQRQPALGPGAACLRRIHAHAGLARQPPARRAADAREEVTPMQARVQQVQLWQAARRHGGGPLHPDQRQRPDRQGHQLRDDHHRVARAGPRRASWATSCWASTTSSHTSRGILISAAPSGGWPTALPKAGSRSTARPTRWPSTTARTICMAGSRASTK